MEQDTEMTIGRPRVRSGVVPTVAEPQLLMHELQVHQIELEMQNAELCQVRDDLEAALARYTDLYDSAPVGFLSLDRQGLVLRANLAAAALLGEGRQEVSSRRLLDALALGARPVLYDFLQRVFAGEAGAGCELALLRPGGTVPVQVTARLDASGRECRAVLQDIGERRRAEEAQRLAAMVYQAIGESIMVTDADNRIVAVNAAFTRVTGYRADEVIGHTPRLLASGRHDRAFYQRMWHSLLANGHWQGEIWNRRKNGEQFTEWLSINTVQDHAGRVLHRVALFSDVTDQKRAEELIWQQAYYDTLTGLPNRRLFQDRLQQEIGRAERSGTALALLFIDLDRFKEVNDTLGHLAGDRLLVDAARRIGDCVRATDTVARLGGDEFAVVMGDLPDGDRVGQVAHDLVERLAQPFAIDEEVIHVSASVGIALYPADAAGSADLLRQADLAMYEAKNQGRNRFRYFTGAMQHAVQARLGLIRDLRGALPGRQLSVLYQPIVELASGRVAKAEALLRWHHPVRGPVSPAEFIPVAEEIGLIEAIGDWVFREAATWAARWRAAAGGPVQVSFNMSPRQFLAGDTSEGWLRHLAELGLPGECLTIEVTEGLLLADRPDITERLGRFHAAGLGIAIDDFGTGYSALSYLKKFAVDYLKIDRSFVRDLEQDGNDRALVEAIIAMAHTLGIRVIAEGVETEAQRDFLLAAGCDYAQGYLYARAMAPEALLAALG